jgi:hypothetical protein
MGPIAGRGALSARHFRIVILLLLFGVLTACKTSQEAANAAIGLTKTSQQLTDYYTDLSNQVADTITLQDMYAELMFAGPMDQNLKTELNTTHDELAKRVALSQALGKLAAAYATLANSKAATDISTAASSLANECKLAGHLPGGGAIPDVVSVAADSLVNYIREKKLRKSSQSISEIVAGIQSFYVSETPAYQTLNQNRIDIAQRVARQLLNRDAVEVSPALAPALKPFNLTPKLPPNQTADEFRRLARVEIARSGDVQMQEFAANTQSLSLALKATSEQVKLVAGKH